MCYLHASPQLLFIDTEGFESTGRANSYDDRIFALSTILSSLLIYNLPETIRESDIAKLSFAVELAGGFYERYGVSMPMCTCCLVSRVLFVTLTLAPETHISIAADGLLASGTFAIKTRAEFR